MKKYTKTLTALSLSGAVLAMASCKSKDNNSDQLASLGKATISGKVMARLADTSGAAGTQYAPAGTVINAWLDSKDLVLNPANSNYARKYFTTTVDASGNYSLTVDVSQYKSATVHIMPADFEYNVVKKMTFPTDSVYTERHVFSSDTAMKEVNNSDVKLLDINYLAQ